MLVSLCGCFRLFSLRSLRSLRPLFFLFFVLIKYSCFSCRTYNRTTAGNKNGLNWKSDPCCSYPGPRMKTSFFMLFGFKKRKWISNPSDQMKKRNTCYYKRVGPVRSVAEMNDHMSHEEEHFPRAPPLPPSSALHRAEMKDDVEPQQGAPDTQPLTGRNEPLQTLWYQSNNRSSV